MEVKRTDYDDGGWCEQQYVDGKLHGRWTVYYASGRKNWEREYQRDRQEGYERNWDEVGNLREEKWYHLGVLHGPWRKWDANGVEELVGDFLFGDSKESHGKWPPKPHSHWELLFPYWMWEPDQFRSQLGAIERVLALPTRRLVRDKSRRLSDEFGASYFGYVNLLGVNEEWPAYQNAPMIPLLQVDLRTLDSLPYFLNGVAFLTMFSRPEPMVAKTDLVIRTYRVDQPLVHARPPAAAVVEKPNFIRIEQPDSSYPDANDLPPGLRALLENELPSSPILARSQHKFSTRIGGWPGWLQWSRVDGYGEFVLQVDSLEIPMLRGGDSAVHHFFHDGAAWTWGSESLSPAFDPSGSH